MTQNGYQLTSLDMTPWGEDHCILPSPQCKLIQEEPPQPSTVNILIGASNVSSCKSLLILRNQPSLYSFIKMKYHFNYVMYNSCEFIL